jgi:hypothetical protein
MRFRLVMLHDARSTRIRWFLLRQRLPSDGFLERDASHFLQP